MRKPDPASFKPDPASFNLSIANQLLEEILDAYSKNVDVKSLPK
jgi:hypothetical protein